MRSLGTRPGSSESPGPARLDLARRRPYHGRQPGRFRLRRLERYVFREVFSPTLLGLAIYTFVMLMSAIFDVAELAIKKNLPASAVLKILSLSLPQLLGITIPMSVLLGI